MYNFAERRRHDQRKIGGENRGDAPISFDPISVTSSYEHKGFDWLGV